MILNTDKVNVEHITTPVRRINMNEMDAESIAVMIENSRDGFYSNKRLAPIREYATNARDAHFVKGTPERPIVITLPCQLEPELRIRDFGNGLTMDELTDIYFKYWKSTKRESNDQNGCLGIGAKSAFAYAPVYTVVSRCKGMITIATGQKNGFADIISHTENTGGEEDGMEIIIPIEQIDIDKFVVEALDFFKYWDIRPIFKNVSDERLTATFAPHDVKPFLFGNGWAVRPAGQGHVESRAVMGFVPYHIDWQQVRSNLTTELHQKISGIFTFLEENLTTLTFSNGSLSFTPNRESLQYNDLTINAINAKLNEIYDCLLKLISEKIADAPNLWEAKISYNRIFRRDLDGFDKSFVYGGSLTTLERILSGRIEWKGIPIKNGLFEDLEDWTADSDPNGERPMLVTYVKDPNKTNGVKAVKTGRGRRRCYGSSSSQNMICSPKSLVVIQDTDKTALAKAYASWALYRSGKDISQVYVLDLGVGEQKVKFYDTYKFYTVPVSFISNNEILIKAYTKSIRAPRAQRTTGDTSDRESRPVNCPFVPIKNRRSGEYISTPSLDNEEIKLRNLDEGGYYVVAIRNTFRYNGEEISFNEGGRPFWQAIYDLALEAGADLEKVYCITPKTAESDWFKEAVEDGDWTHISEFIKEKVDELPKEMLKTMMAFNHIPAQTRLGTTTATSLLPLLVDNNGTAGKYFTEVAEIAKHWHIRNLACALRLDGFDAEESVIQRFTTINQEMAAKYPMLFQTAQPEVMTNVTSNEKNILNDRNAKIYAQYINLIDLYA